MAKSRTKILKISLFALALLAVIGLSVNWYMTYRLKDKLNKTLAEAVSNATNGFYRFSFEKLSVGFLSGELSIYGLQLVPDSLVFDQWQQGDSLPKVYYKINIEEIHFKGVNLTWRRDYKKLKFNLFEVNSPDIKVFEPTYSTDTLDEQHKNRKSQTLYQIVSPYINRLAVSRINLTNMNVSYTVVDSVSPVVYGLKEANFFAFNFLLDENSSESGKLLLCDNFEFSASTPQSLLYSDEIILNTKNIQLSTIDSIIQIDGVDIHPKDEFWARRLEKTGDYLKATVGEVKVKGVGFERRKGLNHLHARTFDIRSTDIQYHSVQRASDDSIPVENKSLQDEPWSLYTILSPILYRTSIDKISVEETKFNYVHTQNNITDVYTLGNFDFHANDFLVDSLSEKLRKFWYVDNFTMIADNIKGKQRSNNSELNVKRLYLDTNTEKFEISDIKIKPLSTNTKKDYLFGEVKSISVDGLEYTAGVSAELLNIESPNIEYFKLTEKNNGKSKDKKKVSPENVLDFFTPYSDFLSVKRINLKNANLIYHNKEDDETFRLKDLNFYASKFLISKETRVTSPYLFTSDDISLSFRDFDNLLFGKKYQLQIAAADVSTSTGEMVLKDIKLIPQAKSWKEASVVYDIALPLIRITGFDNIDYFKDKTIAVKDFFVEAPQIKVMKTKIDGGDNKKKALSPEKSSFLTKLSVDNLSITDPNFIYLGKEEDSLRAELTAFKLDSLKWNIHHNLNIGELMLQSPRVYYANNSKEEKLDKGASRKLNLEFLGKNVNIGKLVVSNAGVNLNHPSDTLDFKIAQFDFSGFIWIIKEDGSSLGLAAINFYKPTLDIRKHSIETQNIDSQTVSSRKDIYSFIAPYLHNLSVGEFNLTDANLNYSNSKRDNIDERQKLNETSLFLRGLTLDTQKRKFDLTDIRFNTKDLSFPIMDGFYTLSFGNINIDRRGQIAEVSDVKMKSTYPKFEFAYKHPKHKDWFDFTMGKFQLSGLDYSALTADNKIKAKHLKIDNVVLLNLKNQQIKIEHNIMPLIYEKIQKLPVLLDIDSANVNNFSVLYEELPKNGNMSGKIHFDNMNGKISGLTNIASYPEQFIRLDVDGKFMGGPFTARWDIPVSADYDCFVLEAKMKQFDMTRLNGVFLPLAKVELQSGILQDFYFRTEASSVDARADMLFRYNDLKLTIFKDIEIEEQNKLLSRIANILVRSNNPNSKRSKPRVADVTLDRDPYHSTFNYFWQILQPALAESVGVSQQKQNMAKKVTQFFSKVKNFFTGKKESKEKEDKK